MKHAGQVKGADAPARSGVQTSIASFGQRLFAPIDIASLALFRVSLGLIYFIEVIRYFAYGRIKDYFIEPKFYFTYFGFGWVSPWPDWGMYAHFVVMGLASFGLMLGLFYRISATLCFLSFTYVFLLDQTNYLNHMYLMCLLGFLMIFLPAHRAFSLDVWRKPNLRSGYVPAWSRGLLLAQLSIVYFYAGIAKLGADWLDAAPLRRWLPKKDDVPIIGPFLEQDWTHYLFAYGGLAFDLLIVPLLLWRRTRILAFIWVVAFHLLNKAVFDIGVFPWLMILGTLLYFPPDWPRRFVRWRAPQTLRPTAFSFSRVTLGVVGAWIVIQLLVPFRHFAYPGVVHWTEEGHRFSWHMMLRSKTGTVQFVVTDPNTLETWRVKSRKYLKARQIKKMATHPDMLLQFAHFLSKAEAMAHGVSGPLEVRVISKVSLNGRPKQPLVDQRTNLAVVRRNLSHALWIVPFRSTETPRNDLPAETSPDAVGQSLTEEGTFAQ